MDATEEISIRIFVFVFLKWAKLQIQLLKSIVAKYEIEDVPFQDDLEIMPKGRQTITLNNRILTWKSNQNFTLEPRNLLSLFVEGKKLDLN